MSGRTSILIVAFQCSEYKLMVGDKQGNLRLELVACILQEKHQTLDK